MKKLNWAKKLKNSTTIINATEKMLKKLSSTLLGY